MSLEQNSIPEPLKKTQNFRLKYKTEVRLALSKKCRYLQ